MTRPIGTATELERRRRRAVDRGESPSTVARVLGVHETSSHRWRRLARQPRGLDSRPVPGPTPGLSDYHLRKLERYRRQGAKRHGWHNDLGTADRVTRLIRARFGVSYHAEHVRKTLKQRLGWTSQKPQRKARERNDKAVERRQADDLSRSLSAAWKRQAHLVFLDKSGFGLTPSVRRTLAPRGQTPVLQAWGRRDRISAIRCITLSPWAGRPGLSFELLPVNQTVHADEVVAFLKDLRRQLRGPFTVVWDRHGIHGKSRPVKAFLTEHPDVIAEDFPGYMPDLNPDEQGGAGPSTAV